jgi:predicted transcriptional regulator
MGYIEMGTSSELETLKLIIGDRKPKKGKELIRIAEQIKTLKEKLGTKELAKKLDVDTSIILDFARIANLDDEMKLLIENSGLGLRAVKVLLSLKNRETQKTVLEASAKLQLTESEVSDIVSCCKSGGDIGKCIEDVLKRKPRHTYLVISNPIPSDIINKVINNVNVVKEVIRKHIGVEVDHAEIRDKRIVLLMKSGAYSKFIEKAVLYNVSEFDLVNEILRKELLKLA